MRHFVCKQFTNPSSFSESGDYCSSPTNLPEVDVRNFLHDVSGLNPRLLRHQKWCFHFTEGAERVAKKVIYWITTVLIAAAGIMAGLTYLSGTQQAVEGFARFAYPQQLRILLGIAKPLGALLFRDGQG